MVINGSSADQKEIVGGKITVKHVTSYIYLGSPITEDGNMNNVINMHIKSRISQINKFRIFCKKK